MVIPKNLAIKNKYSDILFRFLKSTSFLKALLVGIAISLPIILGIVFDHLGIGLALCFGAFWSSPSNTAGSFHHKKLGILFSAALVTIVSFIGGYLNIDLWLLIPVLGVLTFAIAYISIYGFRASLISFSGLLALVLSFAHTPTALKPYEYSLLIGLGGLWYLLLVTIAYYINPKRQTRESLSETFELTSKFLIKRARLMGEQDERDNLQRQLHELQTDLIDHHETLRDILISTRKSSGNSKYQNKQLLIFVQLVEMLETAISNPVDYDKMDILFTAYPQLKLNFQENTFEISKQLKMFAFPIKKNKDITFEKIETLLQKTRNAIKEIDSPKTFESFIILQNLLEYQEKQFEKLKRIQYLRSNPKLNDSNYIATDVLKRFVIPQDYDFKMGVRNFTLKSTIFKHSLRLAVTMMVGFLLGTLFKFQNLYWILLTIIVIMRPSYGLTKTRSKDRIIGTLIGAVLAVGVVLYVKDYYVLGAMGVVSLVIAFSMVQKNYKASATFITLSVVFIYAILSPNVLVVIQYRILDTVIGAALSFMAIKWLWPAWGFLEINENITSSVAACKQFFCQITSVYIDKTNVSTNYKVARKTAFLETSNLNAAFQRMAQEPKSKQKNIDNIYELVVLNHTMLSSLASLSTYLQHHQTTPASIDFKEAVEVIDENLRLVINKLKIGETGGSKNIQISENLKKQGKTLANSSFTELESIIRKEPTNERNFKEAHLIWEQLRWQYSISRKLLQLTDTLKSEQ